MGSFLSTCAISGLPIAYGDDVVAFILFKSYTYRSENSFTGWVGSGVHYQAISLPFYGKYNDYGSIEEIDSTIADPSFRELTGRGVKQMIEEYNDDPDTPMDIDLGGPYGKHMMRLMMVHRGVYDKFSAGGEVRWKQSDLAEQMNLVVPFFDSWEAVTKEHHKEILKEGFARSNGFWLQVASDARYAWWERPNKQDSDPECLLAAFFSSNETDGVHSRLRHGIKNTLAKQLANSKIEDHRDLFESIIQMLFFDIAMTRLRRFWQPPTGLGAQDEAEKVHRQLAQWNLEFLKEKVDERRAYWAEDSGKSPEDFDEDGHYIGED